MFQTEINHLVQSFATAELTTFMCFITSLGYGPFFLGCLLFLFFTVDFKKVAFLFGVLVCITIVTLALKQYFDLPRPYHIDDRIKRLDGRLKESEVFNLSSGGAATFWGKLPESILTITRRAEGLNNGFPSGHTSVAIVFWGSLALLFQKRWLNMLALTLMVLVPFSRIYLGVHFLGDIVGGLILGGALLLIIYLGILHPKRRARFF